MRNYWGNIGEYKGWEAQEEGKTLATCNFANPTANLAFKSSQQTDGK